MKQLRFLIVLLGFFVFFACSSSSTKKEQDSSDVDTVQVFENKFSIDSVKYADSSFYLCSRDLDDTVYADSLWMHIKYNCSYPVTDNPNWQKARQNILYWICDVFGDSTHTNWNNLEQLLRNSGNRTMKCFFSQDRFCTFDHEEDIRLNRIFENDTLVTFYVLFYEYWGGAHESDYYEARTFNKNTGHQYGFDLLSKYDKKTLNGFILNGLKEYFGCSSDEELHDGLFDEVDLNDIPLPSTPPYITEDGIEIVYNRYEIACYAAGMPSLVIPWTCFLESKN